MTQHLLTHRPLPQLPRPIPLHRPVRTSRSSYEDIAATVIIEVLDAAGITRIRMGSFRDAVTGLAADLEARR